MDELYADCGALRRRFWSMNIRALMLPNAEDLCADDGQVATSLGKG